MFFKARLECGVEVMINPAHVSATRFTPTGVQVEFPSGKTIFFPAGEANNIRKGLELDQGTAEILPRGGEYSVPGCAPALKVMEG